MKSEIKEVSPTQREIKIEIDAATLKDAYGKVSRNYAQRASVPGFRKGYAPLDVVRIRFKNEIRSEVLQNVVPNAVAGAIQEHGLQPLAEPHLHLDDQENAIVNGSVPLSLHAHVEVMPDVPEPRYAGVDIVRRVKPIEPGEVDALIADRRKREAALLPVEGRTSELGDTVIVDLEGKFDDDPTGESITAKDLEIVLGDEAIERSFSDNLIGVKEEDEKKFTVTYPETFSSEALAGKTVHYDARVKSVGRVEMPELNDEWAKSLEEGFESLADLHKKLKLDLETYAEADADARVRNEAVARMIESHPFEVPATLIENQTRNLLNNFARDMQQRGVDLNKLDENFVHMAYENMRNQAERDVRGAMLLDKVAEAEKIQVSDDDVEAEIGKLAEYYNAPVDEVRSSMAKQSGGIDSIKNSLRTRKAIEAVVEKAKVTKGEWTEGSPDATETVKKPKASSGKKESRTDTPAKKAAKKG